MSLREAALSYLERGWSVIPIGRATKKPLIRWADFQRRLPSTEEVNLWWRQYPDANIGIVTGKVSGLVVVDVDSSDPTVVQSILDQYPTDMVVTTGSGGSHLYYSYPIDLAHVSNSVGSVDIRGDGGYVVAPPSLHASGARYEWKKIGPLAPFPKELARIRGAGSRGEEGWILRLMAGVEAGERNNACARLAGYYVSKGLPEDVILHTLTEWNMKNDPPLPEREVRTTLESVIQTAIRRNNGLSGPTSASTSTPTASALTDPFALLSLPAFMSRFGAQPVEWTIEKWLPERTIALMVAPPGNFKTWMLLDLAISVSSGTPFLGQFPVLQPGPVIIIQQEDYLGQLAERLGTIAATRFDTIKSDDDEETFSVGTCPDLPIHLHVDRNLRFSDSVVMQALERQIAEIRPRVVLIDPLYSAGETDDYMAKTVAQMFPLKAMRDMYGTSFLLAHHTKKSGTGGTEREDLWGSQFLNAFLETGWQIRPVSGKASSIKIRRHFKSAQNVKDETLRFDIETAGPSYNYRVSAGTVEEENDALLPDDVSSPVTRDILLERRIMYILKDRPRTLNSLKRTIKTGNVEGAVASLLAEGQIVDSGGRLAPNT